jgi:UDP-glucuronate 4-epimerase
MGSPRRPRPPRTIAAASQPVPAGAGGWRVLVTGAAGRVGFPLTRALAQRHDVYGLARCRGEGDRQRLAAAGVRPIVGDVASFDFGSLPGGTGSAYDYQGQRPLREDDPPGVHLGAYSLSKIAGERSSASPRPSPARRSRSSGSSRPTAPRGGTPVNRLRRILAGKEVVLHPDAPNNYNPIYADDYVRLTIRALQVASADQVVVNFAGSETVSAEEYCAYLGELAAETCASATTRPHRGALARGHAPGRTALRLRITVPAAPPAAPVARRYPYPIGV